MPRPRASQLSAWSGDALTAGSRYELVRFTGLQLFDQYAKGAAFDRVDLERTRLAAAHFEQSELVDVRIVDCDLSNARFDRALLRRVHTGGSRLTGLTAPEALLEDVRFEDCDLTLVQFRFCRFKGVRFEHCNLREADFGGTELPGTVFRDCQLQAADFSQASAPEMDIRGSNIDDIKLSPEQMKGGSVDFDQALYLMRLLGLNVGGVEGEDEADPSRG